MLAPRHALITGAGSGIGAAIALALAQQGCRLTLAGRSHDKLQQQAERLRAQVPALALVLAPMDVSDPHSVQAAVQQAQAINQSAPLLVVVSREPRRSASSTVQGKSSLSHDGKTGSPRQNSVTGTYGGSGIALGTVHPLPPFTSFAYHHFFFW